MGSRVFIYAALWLMLALSAVNCGNQKVDNGEFVCCEGNPHAKAWDDDTECCSAYAFNPKLETCCNGQVNPGFGSKNEHSQCCETQSFDNRCFECEKSRGVRPRYDFRAQTCCDGDIVNLLRNKTCCCGNKAFDPTDLVCCDGKIIKRPKDIPGDCCNCGLTLVDLIIVLDSSESIQSENWPKMLDFTVSILKDADIDDDEVRVGVLSYRHNTTVEIHLDDYHNRDDLFNAIQSIRYVRGSTATGDAIQRMREDMFDFRHGDRPNVDNVCIVITDGDSDNYTHTVDQAKLARDNGIHIFAIGIALKNLTELKNIATPAPGDGNVLSIDDFDHLESLRGKIFASICTGTPIINVYEPCGEDFFNPQKETCCNGKPQPLVAEKTICCGQKSYDNSKQICCEDELNDRNAKDITCCGKKAFDPEKALCCEEKVAPRAGPEYTECCSDKFAYNPKTEVCCEGFVAKAFGNPKKDTGCCAEFSYDQRCFECSKGKVRPMFDWECQICCDGTVHNMTLDPTCCCGAELFNPKDEICCKKELRKRQGDELNHDCCECGSALADIVFVLDSSESVDLSNWGKLLTFVEDIIASADVDTGKTRIGLETYRHNVTVEFHLDEHIRTQNMIDHVMGIPYVRGSTNTADAIENMFDVMFSPKYGDRPNVPNIAIVITDGLSDDSESTMEAAELAKAEGIHIYAIAVGLKVSAELRAIASDPWKQNLFTLENFDDLVSLRAQMFDAIASACPQSPRQCPTKPCGSKQYDPRTQVCCNGEPQPLYQNEKFTMCCAQVSYDKRTQMCCKDKVNKIPSGAKKPVCCEDKAMDPVHAMCCAGDVIPKSSPDADVCCGSSTYSEKTGICCEDILYQNKWAKDGACCVMKDGSTEVYDTRCYDCINGTLVPKYDCAFQRCCDGVIQEITSPSSCCCGKKAFDPEDQICCDGKLSKRKPSDIPDCCSCAKNIVDIVIVLDSSESVSEVNWRKMEEAVEDIIGAAAIPESRFGLLTYNHFSTIRFQMNTFVNKQELLDAVDNLPYIRGSTDTGTALETMRGMFNPKFGDRQDAPNFCLLMTDGESDDYDNTIEQANLAKKKGITIVGIGVGLKNATELRNIASSPADENAVLLKDFDELKKVTDRIFNDLASSICPQNPKPRCRTPCGNSSIDEDMEICCHGVPQKKIAGEDTKCCGYKAYDPDCFMCCMEEVLVSRYAGKYTECCCRVAYDSRSHMCCGNNILPLVAGDDTACCHNTTYDTTKEVCCDNFIVQPSYGAKNTDCCNGVSYDTRCYECVKEEIKPKFDTEKELCCQGKIDKKQFDERSCCCGPEQFDVDKSICCEDNLFKRPKGGEVVCCGGKTLNPKKMVCCDDKAARRRWGTDTCCCGRKSYDQNKFHCCEGKINVKKSDKDTCCCGNKVFDGERQVCCDNEVNDLAKSGMRNSSICCGKKAFDPTKEICCDNVVRDLNKDSSTACCENKAYDPEKSKCEQGKVHPIDGGCTGRKYNPKVQTCCNGWINNETFSDPYARCCFDRAYDARKHVCCCNGNLEEAFAGIYTQCCYSFAYDARYQTCCDGQIVDKPYPTAECCCGRQAYDSNHEICCNGVVNPCGTDKVKCCDTVAYDPVLEICCGGKLYPRRYGEDTFCCGDVAYTPMLAACCGDRIAYEKKINMEW
ncbi:uncharacterized protein LOC128215858 [Mya arenaria]|uniref:uncharacterized protein LOC128215858 n=1 Tax=Mya arenaria TaxID=6604 RepID=UPI0022E6F037|nr:uncharacterized protein LOC128215858 [Mya arenaria]